jgi:hypothetical protein
VVHYLVVDVGVNKTKVDIYDRNAEQIALQLNRDFIDILKQSPQKQYTIKSWLN